MGIVINTDITRLNKMKRIFKYFHIPEDARESDYDFSTNYSYKFIEKKPTKNKYSSVEEFFLSLAKPEMKMFDERPKGAKKKDFRPIINYEHGSDWLKKAQKKFHKIIAKGIGDVPYLHSTLKGTSYSTNGIVHASGRRYMLCLDISSFFTQIKRNRVYRTIKNSLDVDKDVALFYSKMVTAPMEKGLEDFVLAQGLPSSPILAFLCYKSLFDCLYEYSISNGITFTLYVDDMTFSSKEPIPQAFMNRIFGLLKSKKYHNQLKLNKEKIHYLSSRNWKKITGVCIVNGEPKIPNKKHFQLHVLYKKLLNLLHNKLDSFEEYCYFCKYFEKFSGNLMYLIAVEYSNNFELIRQSTNRRHKHMYIFYDCLRRYIRPGLVPISNDGTIDFDKIDSSALSELRNRYQGLSKEKSTLKNRFQMIH